MRRAEETGDGVAPEGARELHLVVVWLQRAGGQSTVSLSPVNSDEEAVSGPWLLMGRVPSAVGVWPMVHMHATCVVRSRVFTRAAAGGEHEQPA